MEYHLKLPLNENAVRQLKMGDTVLLSGKIFTGRDIFHSYLLKNENLHLPFSLKGSAIYHCGPIVRRGSDGKWQITAAGPTTSARTEIYIPEIIRRYGIRVVMGKGGMGHETSKACRECGCVYLNVTGGCAQGLSECIEAVKNVYFLDEFGSPEAVWELEVKSFPGIVTMDAHGQNLHEIVRLNSKEKLKSLII